MVAKCADCWQVARRLRAGCSQAARRLRVKKTRHRLVGRVAKCPQLRANCVKPPTIEAIGRVPYFADIRYVSILSTLATLTI